MAPLAIAALIGAAVVGTVALISGASAKGKDKDKDKGGSNGLVPSPPSAFPGGADGLMFAAYQTAVMGGLQLEDYPLLIADLRRNGLEFEARSVEATETRLKQLGFPTGTGQSYD